MDELIIMGQVIRSLRKKNDLSQFSVAQRSGINLSYYCRIEGGKANPTVRMLYLILRTLGVSPVQFIELVSLEMHYLLINAGIAEPA